MRRDYEWWDDRRLSAVDEPRRLGHCCDHGAYCSCMESELGAGCTAPDCGDDWDEDEDGDEGDLHDYNAYYDGSQDLSSHDGQGKCREYDRQAAARWHCCGRDYETWCADGTRSCAAAKGEHDCWPGKKWYRQGLPKVTPGAGKDICTDYAEDCCALDDEPRGAAWRLRGAR